MHEFALSRRLAAEGLETAFLVATVVGSGIMASSLIQDMALALVGNTLATGAILIVLITILGPISGAHFNPAVSLIFVLSRSLPGHDFIAYVAAQITGGICGTIFAHLMFAHPILEWSLEQRAGGSQWLAEWIATFGLGASILLGMRFDRKSVPWLVGLYITAAYWFTTPSTSFANPAVALARSLTNTFSEIRPADLPGFIVAELGLDNAELTNDQLLDAMLKDPILINRPFVVSTLGTRLSRPSEVVLEILPDTHKGPFAKEDGERVIDAEGNRLV